MTSWSHSHVKYYFLGLIFFQGNHFGFGLPFPSVTDNIVCFPCVCNIFFFCSKYIFWRDTGRERQPDIHKVRFGGRQTGNMILRKICWLITLFPHKITWIEVAYTGQMPMGIAYWTHHRTVVTLQPHLQDMPGNATNCSCIAGKAINCSCSSSPNEDLMTDSLKFSWPRLHQL